MTTSDRLNPKSPVPLYLQVKTILSDLVLHGEVKPNERLPSERELGEELGVSRMTVRQAVQALIREGLLYTRAGKGTFVSEIRLEQDRALTGFTEEMRRRGLEVTNKVLDARIIPATSKLAEKLEINRNSGVIRISRLRLANGQVVALENAHLPHSLFPTLLEHDFSRESLYDVLRRDYGVRLLSADQTIEAALANHEELRMLQLTPPAAVLRMQRITRSEQRVVVEYVESVYRSDRYKLNTTLHAIPE